MVDVNDVGESAVYSTEVPRGGGGGVTADLVSQVSPNTVILVNTGLITVPCDIPGGHTLIRFAETVWFLRKVIDLCLHTQPQTQNCSTMLGVPLQISDGASSVEIALIMNIL